MQWTELVVTVNQKYKQALEDAALVLADSFYMEDYSDIEERVQQITRAQIIEQGLLDMPRDIVRLHLYYSQEEDIADIVGNLHYVLVAAGIEYTLASEQLDQQEWETAWKKYYHPFNIGERLAVVPLWEEYETERTVIKLDPGMAFGTGTHETTYMCMEFLDKLVIGGEEVLDIGTGSGILAIASLLLGAKHATGIDIDPLCVRIAGENAQNNNVQDRLQVRVGDLAQHTSGKYNIITANIIADAIIALSSAIPSLMAQGASFIASGIIADRKENVLAALHDAGLKCEEIKQDKEWVCILAHQ